jgi:hypothetical protein
MIAQSVNLEEGVVIHDRIWSTCTGAGSALGRESARLWKSRETP